MRISFFVPRCTPDNSHGRYVIELAKRLGREHHVVVYSGAFWPPLHFVVRCRRVPVANRPVVARLATLWAASLLATKRWPSDIVHIQGADAPVGSVVTAHFCNKVMLATGDHSLGLYRRLNYAIGAAVEKYCMSKPSTRMIIAVSEQVRCDIEREYGVDSRRIVVINHGVDAVAFHPQNRTRWRAPVRERLGLGPNEFVVLFVGRDYQRKGLLTLLAALRQLPPIVKVLGVGVQPDATLGAALAQYGLEDRVQCVEGSSDIAEHYAAADCFALPSRYDTFSLATLEAMASGLPVIVSRVAGVSECLTDGVDALLLDDPNDTETLVGHLRRLAGDTGFRALLGRAARGTAERHAWERVVEETLAVYRGVLGTHA